MTVYDFEGGTNGNAYTTAAGGGAYTNQSGNTGIFSNEQFISGTLGVKITHGTPGSTPVNPTSAASLDFYGTGVSGATGTTWGTPSRLNSAFIPIWVPVGGFAASSGGFTTLVQFYGGSTGSATIGRIQAADKSSGAQLLRFANGASSQIGTILADISAYEGGWLILWYQMDTNTTNATGSMKVRVSNNPYGTVPASDNLSVNSYDLGSAGGTTYPVTRVKAGVMTVQAAPKVLYFDYINIDPSTTWLAAPSGASAPVAVVTADTQYPTVGDNVTLTVSATTGANTSRTLSLQSPIAGFYAGQPAYPVGTTPPTITSPTTTTTTTVTNLQTGQTWLRLRAVGTGGTTDAYIGIFCSPINNADTKIQKSTLTGYTSEGSASTPEAGQNDASNATYLQGPASATAAAYVTEMCAPVGLGGITIYEDYGQNNDVGDGSNYAWFLEVYTSDGSTLLESFTWNSTAAQSGQVLTYPAVLGSATLSALPDKASRRSLIKKKWAVIS